MLEDFAEERNLDLTVPHIATNTFHLRGSLHRGINTSVRVWVYSYYYRLSSQTCFLIISYAGDRYCIRYWEGGIHYINASFLVTSNTRQDSISTQFSVKEMRLPLYGPRDP